MNMRNFAFGTLAICLLPLTALADGGPECVFDPDIGTFVAPNGSGACFADFGFTVGITDFADFEQVWAINEPDSNQWMRLHPNGKLFAHRAGKFEGLVVYCSAVTVLAGNCVPGNPELFVGTGKVMLNSYLSEGSYSCPLTVRVTGTGEDGYNNKVSFEAAITLVPDADGGCKATVEIVEATPIVD